jgi:HAD superfamily hydrolase (TIGR01509 family)
VLLERNGDNTRRNLARSKNLAGALKRLGAKISVDKLDTAIDAMVPWLTSIWKTDRDITHLDQIRFIVRKASDGSVKIEKGWFSELSSAYISPLFKIPPYLEPNISNVLKQLRNQNILTGIICNTGRTPGFGIRRFLENEGVAKYFDHMLFSDEIGIRKPDPRIFQIAATKLNVKLDEIVHVGDNLKSDVWGAKKAGLKAIYFSTNIGKDETEENNPSSLVAFSRKLGDLKEKNIIPDNTITTLDKLIEAIESL